MNAMAFIEIPNVALVELVYNHLGEVCENTLYIRDPAGWTFSKLDDLCALMKGWWDTEMQALASAATSLDKIIATDQADANGPTALYTTGLPLAGTAASAPMPGNVTAATTFLTDLRGRSYRGRNYFVGLVENAVTGNALDSSYQAGIQAAYEALPALLTAEGWTHVVASRYTGKAPRGTGISTTVSAYRTEQYIDSQRRRLAGRGL